MRWTREMNIELIRAYFLATENETEMTNYRIRLEQLWQRKYPNTSLTAQRLSDQARSVLRRKALSNAEIDALKQEAANSLNPEAVEEDIREEAQAEAEPVETLSETTELPSLKLELEEKLKEYILLYGGMNQQLRPPIPKLKYAAKSKHIVTLMNEILEHYLQEYISLEELHHLTYCAAVTVSHFLGNTLKMEYQTARKNKDNIAPWKVRLENKITNIRKDIGKLHNYLNKLNSASQKLKKKIKIIAKRAKINHNSPDYLTKLHLHLDKCKQKAAALGARIRRYNERVKTYRDNKSFSENPGSFYRGLENNILEPNNGSLPEPHMMLTFWQNIWSTPVYHDDDAYWIQEETEAHSLLPPMPQMVISEEHIRTAVRKTANWKAPGPDKIQNYWWKYFTALHKQLAQCFQSILQDPTSIPKFLTVGVTTMLPKNGNLNEPKNFRPITCLPTLYKLLTSVVGLHIEQHLTNNKILATEQNGCRKGSQGSRELLVIDTTITHQARTKQRSLSVAWIDYRKAFDSVPHSWLIKTLEIYKIDEKIINLFKSIMDTWTTRLRVKSAQTEYLTEPINIKRGIFQGDSFSPMWFCLSLNPLSNMLKRSNYGYRIEGQPRQNLSHLFYMDDLKLFAANEQQLQSELELVAKFSKSIHMEFGLDKCAILNSKKGKISDRHAIKLLDGMQLNCLEAGESYKYLGFQQALNIQTGEMKDRFQNELKRRVRAVLKTRLNSKNTVSAINTWAIPAVSFTFGVLKWSNTDLQALDRMVRVLLTSYRSHHPRSSTARLYLPRIKGGRGLISLEFCHERQKQRLCKYFRNSQLPLHISLIHADQNLTPLNLSRNIQTPTENQEQILLQEWQSKALHGRFAASLRNDAVDGIASTLYLSKGWLKRETEGAISAIQDQVVSTRYYCRHILKQNIPTDMCRICGERPETIQHIISGCSVIAPKEYINRHNNIAKVVHNHLCHQNNLKKVITPFWKYEPDQVIENEHVKIYWDTQIITDRAVVYNKPDIIILNKRQKFAYIVDFAVPVDDNITKSYVEKLTKYQDLAYELKHIYELDRVEVIPLIISANGLIEKRLIPGLERMGLKRELAGEMQKAAILGTCHIVRRYLSRDY